MPNPPPWTTTEDKLLRALRPNLTNSQIAKVLARLGIERSTEAIRKRSKVLGIRFIEPGRPNTTKLHQNWKDAVEEIIEEDIAEPLLLPPKPRTPSEKSKVTTINRNAFTSMYDELREIREQTPRRPEQKELHLADESLSMCVLLSDFHVGRVVEDPASGEISYDTAIASERLDTMFQTIMSQVAIDTARVEEVVLLLAGDLVDGEGIFPGQEMELDTHLPGQTRLVTRKLWNLIGNFANTFPRVRIVTVRGNHGRTNASPEANWDTMVYQSLELLLDMTPQIDNVSISNRYGLFSTFEVRGWKGLMRHWAPVQADTASAIRTIAGWHEIHQFDQLIYGHYHHWGVGTWNGRPLFRNGSLYGGDDYAERFGAQDEPHQLVWTTSYEKVVNGIYPIRFT